MAVVEADVAQDRLFEVLAGAEAMALPYRCGAFGVSRVRATLSSGRCTRARSEPVRLDHVGPQPAQRHRCARFASLPIG